MHDRPCLLDLQIGSTVVDVASRHCSPTGRLYSVDDRVGLAGAPQPLAQRGEKHRDLLFDRERLEGLASDGLCLPELLERDERAGELLVSNRSDPALLRFGQEPAECFSGLQEVPESALTYRPAKSRLPVARLHFEQRGEPSRSLCILAVDLVRPGEAEQCGRVVRRHLECVA